MKIAVVSDIHLEFYEKGIVSEDRINVWGGFSLPRNLQDHADVLVIAGDIHPEEYVRDNLIKEIKDRVGIETFMVLGNHDYYGSCFPDPSYKEWEGPDGKTIIGATLWTDLSGIDEHFPYPINDRGYIGEYSPYIWTKTHRIERDLLCSDSHDVVVSHHLPTLMSYPPKYLGEVCQPFYVTEYNERLEGLKKTKLWIHGHTHYAADVIVGSVRVISNPLGYPGELYESPERYYPIIVEV